jgi:hypothetical protein
MPSWSRGSLRARSDSRISYTVQTGIQFCNAAMVFAFRPLASCITRPSMANPDSAWLASKGMAPDAADTPGSYIS